MEERHGLKNRPRASSEVDSPKRLDAQPGAYHAKALLAQTRLFETLDVLDEMERAHAEQLALNERREGRLRQKMKVYAEASRKAEEETEDMRQAVLKLINKVERNNGYKSVKPSQIHVSSLLEPIDHPPTSRVSPAEMDDLLSYAASIIEATRRERTLERKAHQKTKEWAQARIATLEAQLARREAELAHCATHCVPGFDPAAPPEDHMPYQQCLDTLQRTISKNKSLEMEINTLSDKLSGVRLQGKHFEEAPPNSATNPHLTQDPGTKSSLVQDLDRQVRELGSLVDALKQDRENWRKVIDSEKTTLSSHSISERLRAVEDECARLRKSDEELRQRLEATNHQEHVRDIEMKQRIELLDSQITAMALHNPQQDGDSDTIRVSPPRAPSPKPDSDSGQPPPHEDLLDDGEMSMDLATPLMPTVFMEPPALQLEMEYFEHRSPNPAPLDPSLPPSPFQLSPASMDLVTLRSRYPESRPFGSIPSTEPVSIITGLHGPGHPSIPLPEMTPNSENIGLVEES
ncbi:hypothetical protein D9611_002967 [Ephemerocybe angulata]|uniref:Uncharacterized protein n=1 Tax=Ephemerocybe angulata TaxID=980116 RepID=A0A8H5CB14_9AGAR|nr:hypothetical protein D9611_002967 [Tulosesus angulatus]